MAEQEFDELKLRRKRLIEASQTPRSQDEIKAILKPYKTRNIEFVIDDRECTITRTFDAMVAGDNNSPPRLREVALSVSGNLRRPIEDFEHDVKWLLAQVGSIRDAQRGQIRGKA